MRNLLTLVVTLLLVSFATTAMAERGNGPGGQDKYVSKGERVQKHLDRKGDRIEHRFEHKADRAEARGKYRQAEHFRAQGERINRHLDRKGDRIRARHDRHDHHRHHYAKDHRHHKHERVTYRDYEPFKSRIGVIISQPGLWLGGSWRN